MPCDTIQTSTVEFRPENAAFFKAALQTLGYQVAELNGMIHATKGFYESVTLNAGQLEIKTVSNVTADSIKQAYSREIVTFAAQEFGFELERTSENEYSVQKVGF